VELQVPLEVRELDGVVALLDDENPIVRMAGVVACTRLGLRAGVPQCGQLYNAVVKKLGQLARHKHEKDWQVREIAVLGIGVLCKGAGLCRNSMWDPLLAKIVAILHSDYIKPVRAAARLALAALFSPGGAARYSLENLTGSQGAERPEAEASGAVLRRVPSAMATLGNVFNATKVNTAARRWQGAKTVTGCKEGQRSRPTSASIKRKSEDGVSPSTMTAIYKVLTRKNDATIKALKEFALDGKDGRLQAKDLLSPAHSAALGPSVDRTDSELVPSVIPGVASVSAATTYNVAAFSDTHLLKMIQDESLESASDEATDPSASAYEEIGRRGLLQAIPSLIVCVECASRPLLHRTEACFVLGRMLYQCNQRDSLDSATGPPAPRPEGNATSAMPPLSNTPPIPTLPNSVPPIPTLPNGVSPQPPLTDGVDGVPPPPPWPPGLPPCGVDVSPANDVLHTLLSVLGEDPNRFMRAAAALSLGAARDERAWAGLMRRHREDAISDVRDATKVAIDTLAHFTKAQDSYETDNIRVHKEALVKVLEL